MKVTEAAPLAPLTTFRLGGPARVLAEVESVEDIRAALALARERGLPIRVLGGGSNLLVPDEGIDALVLHPVMESISYREEGDQIFVTAQAGARWEAVVDAVLAKGLWGIENLAGIPGTIGGAAVQNIGAYGAELSTVFAYADAIRLDTEEMVRITREAAAFTYRTSVFKRDRSLFITEVTLVLAASGTPAISYSDLRKAQEAGVPLSTPEEIARAVRAIRAKKFPGPGGEGTAGSFFKNPVLTAESVTVLKARYPEMPVFALPDGTSKVSLAWLLDHALGLKGYANGPARLYEAQPLVIVAEEGAHACDVDMLAREIAGRVKVATNIIIEREVETFGVHA